MKTSIDINFPELTEFLNPWRDDTVELAHKGVPPHITLIFPWIPAPIKVKDAKNIDDILKNISTFFLEFTTVDKFANGTVYLVPKDSGNMQKIHEEIISKYPTVKMYDGEFSNTIFHLTIAKVGDDENKYLEIKNHFEKHLPIKKQITKITIMQEDKDGIWSEYLSINLK